MAHLLPGSPDASRTWRAGGKALVGTSARGKVWAEKIAGRSEVTVRIPSVRGEIKDRNGLTLVSNRASYEVDFYLPDMVRGYKQMYPDEKLPNVTYRGTVQEHGAGTRARRTS